MGDDGDCLAYPTTFLGDGNASLLVRPVLKERKLCSGVSLWDYRLSTLDNLACPTVK